jgi:DNA-binding HxlR family transcriptional regulator
LVDVERRSPCPVACLLDIAGDRWTLLIIRDLMLGRSRFKEFSESPEGIPTNILSDRLVRLLEHEIVEQIPAEDGTKRFAYQLTKKGQALRPVLLAMRDWGLKWEKGTRASLPRQKQDDSPSRTDKDKKR